MFLSPLDYNKEINTKVDKTLQYIYFIDKMHPLSDVNGKVYYHRHMASMYIERWLTKDEIVHHKDEDKQNNSKDNLEVMTSNDHSRYHTLDRYDKKGRVVYKCENCSGRRVKNRKYCPECAILLGKKAGILNELTKEELEEIIWKIPSLEIAKLYNCSDVAIAQKCKKFGIEKPGRGYWAKLRSKKD